MPWGDGTGPMGAGPMTGRGAGYCGGHSVPGRVDPCGRSWGPGRGWRHRYCATGVPGWARERSAPYAPVLGFDVAREDDAKVMKAQVEYLEEALESSRTRLAELESRSSE